MGIKVYGTKRCAQCKGVQEYLKQKGIDFEYADVNQDDAALEEIKAIGALSLPVIKKGNKYCIGFNVKLLEEVLNNGNA